MEKHHEKSVIKMIRTDGYYYRLDSKSGNIEILIFLKNGSLLQGYFQSEANLSSYLANKEILLTSRHALGTFNIIRDSIVINYPIPKAGNELASKWELFEETGVIIDENTLQFYKGITGKKIIHFEHYYEFKETNIPIIKVDK